MVILVYLVLCVALTGHSSAIYCICKDGVSDSQLQKTLDYACGAGADCTPILQNGACYQPNTVKDHCNYAVNSYFQRKGQAPGSCDFSSTATTSANTPANVASACVYPASPSNTGIGTTTPTTGPTTPSTGTGTGTTTPTTGPTTPSTGTGTGITTPTTGPSNPSTGTTTPFVGPGLGPTGSGTGFDNGATSIETVITALFFNSLTTGLFLLLWV